MTTEREHGSQPGPLFGDHFTDVNAEYILGKRLGSGNFAKVLLGQTKRPMPLWKLQAGDGVAVKVVKKPSSLRAVERVQMLRAEVEILRSIRHPNIVQLFELYESPNRLYLVMELLTGGELFDRIVGLGKYSEDDARYFTFKLLNAVLYLHDRGICHRDLKPENVRTAADSTRAARWCPVIATSAAAAAAIAAAYSAHASSRCFRFRWQILLASPEPDAELKIADFGLSKMLTAEDFIMTTRCGTPGYVAPEVSSSHPAQCAWPVTPRRSLPCARAGAWSLVSTHRPTTHRVRVGPARSAAFSGVGTAGGSRPTTQLWYVV